MFETEENKLKRLFTFSGTEFATDLECTNGYPVALESIEWTNPNKDTTWIMLTAVAGGKPVGFTDIRYFPPGKIAELEASQFKIAHTLNAPYQEIRNPRVCGDDGFYVLLEERSEGIGNELFTRSITILKEKGAERLMVKYPKKRLSSFYEKHGGHKIMGTYHFDLRST
mgnify:CR=1 FL=1